MKKIPTEFNKNTFQYTQVWRDENYAIYEQSDNGKFVAYEVFKIKKYPAWQGFGKLNDASEAVPSTNECGSNAYTLHNLEDCFDRIKDMRVKIKSLLPSTAQISTISEKMNTHTQTHQND